MDNTAPVPDADQPGSDSRINRREMAKLLGAVTALSASLGATFVTASASMPEGAQLQLQFLKPAPNGDPEKAQLFCAIDISPKDRRTLASTEGPVELRLSLATAIKEKAPGKGEDLVDQKLTIASQVIPAATWMEIKQHGDPQDD